LSTLEFRSYRNLDAPGLIQALRDLARDGGAAEAPALDGAGGGARSWELARNRRVEILWLEGESGASVSLSLDDGRRFPQKLSGEGLAQALEAIGLDGPEADVAPGEATLAELEAALATLDIAARGGRRIDAMLSGAGDDRLRGRGEADLMLGSAGGDDLFKGGEGRDRLSYLGGLDPLGEGLTVDLAAGRVEKAGGVDRLTGVEQLVLSDFADAVQGGERGAVALHLAGGDDRYEDARGTRSWVDGGEGDDRLRLGGGDDFGGGGAGADRLRGAQGEDHLRGGAGADRLGGGAGEDRLEGDGGRDLLVGGGGADRLGGGRGDDVLSGGAGGDLLRGGPGAEAMFGGAGRDKLVGADGADRYDGGAGRDLLVFADRGGSRDVAVLREGDGRDVIRGFAAEEDRFALDGLGFDALSFVERRAGVEIRAGEEALALVKGETAATLDDAGLFL